MLELGPQPLANSFLTSPEEFEREAFFPLDLYFCEGCSLVQLLDVIDPEVMFRNYLYVSGTSEALASHHVEYAQTVVDLLQLGPEDRVIEVASNDGSLLSCFRRHGVRILGIEPATNIAELARERGIKTVNRFFSQAVAREVVREYGPAKLVLANNVLAHVDDTQDFLRGCKDLLGPSGVVVVQMHYLRRLVEKLAYDTIYHEHACYFSLTALLRLCEAAGLSIARAEEVPIHGGSLRIHASRREDAPAHADEVLAMAKEEEAEGLTSLARFRRFGEEVARHRSALRGFLDQLRSEDICLAGYGAAAKGNTLLNYCGVNTSDLPYIVDKNPLKVGLYSPGTHIPVLAVETLVERQPGAVVILAWNFEKEIVRQQGAYVQQGGKFFVPIPRPTVVGALD